MLMQLDVQRVHDGPTSLLRDMAPVLGRMAVDLGLDCRQQPDLGQHFARQRQLGDALPGKHLHLPIQRQRVGGLADHHVCDQRLGRHAPSIGREGVGATSTSPARPGMRIEGGA